MRAELKLIVNQLKELQRVKQVWLNLQEGGKKMHQTRRRVNLLKKKLADNDQPEFRAELERELKDQSSALEALVAVRDGYSKQISAKEGEETKTKSKLRNFTKRRRGSAGSVYTHVDKIFQMYGANRAHYFGRKFEGVDIRKIMDEADKIFGRDGTGGDIRECLVSRAEGEAKKKEASDICDELGDAFRAWDAVFKAIHEESHSDERCDEIQKMITAAMKHLRKLSLSVIPKLHGMEAHLVDQLKLVGWGFRKMVEHWVEQYHQVGYRYDVSYCRLGSLEKQAGVRSRLEARSRHPKVKMNRRRLEELEAQRKHKNKKSEEKARVKEERREKAVAALEAKLVRLGNKKLNFLAALDDLIEVEAL